MRLDPRKTLFTIYQWKTPGIDLNTNHQRTMKIWQRSKRDKTWIPSSASLFHLDLRYPYLTLATKLQTPKSSTPSASNTALFRRRTAINRATASDPNASTLATNSFSRIVHDDDNYTLYNATATDTSGQRRRVKQDAASTRALQGLLGASLVLLIITWLFTYREANVLPRPPTSIASVAALIAGGNLLTKLPPDVQRLDKEAFAAALGVGSKKTTKYWIGWRTVPDLENGGKTRRFGIFAVEEGDDELTEDSESEEDAAGEEAPVDEEDSVGDEAAGRRSTASVDRFPVTRRHPESLWPPPSAIVNECLCRKTTSGVTAQAVGINRVTGHSEKKSRKPDQEK